MTAPAQPRFFGPADRQLFGMYHAPTVGARRAGVVICPAGPQEYRQTHWATRTLASTLADHGLHVLRFDYSGTGDSAGDDTDVDLEAWVRDTQTAIDELRDIANVRRIALVGLRLGAAIAWRAASAESSPTDLVLWEPVTDGRDHLARLTAAHAWTLRESIFPESRERLDGELLGFVMPDAMQRAIGEIDLAREPLATTSRTLLVHAAGRSDCVALGARFDADGRAHRRVEVTDTTFQRDEDWGVNTLFLHQGSAQIADFLAERAA